MSQRHEITCGSHEREAAIVKLETYPNNDSNVILDTNIWQIS